MATAKFYDEYHFGMPPPLVPHSLEIPEIPPKKKRTVKKKIVDIVAPVLVNKPVVPGEPLEDTPEVIKCRDFIQKNVSYYNSSNSTWLYQGVKDSNSGISAPCHARMRQIDNPRALSSAFNVGGDHLEYGDAFIKFMISDRSPYRSVLKDGIEFIRDPLTRDIKGFVLPEKVVTSNSFSILKNFCILMRSLPEYCMTIEAWYWLTKQGMLPEDALYLCYNFQTKDNGRTYSIRQASVPSGSHWGITDNETYSCNLDWKRWKSGTPNQKVPENVTYYQPTNGVFGIYPPPNKYSPFMTVQKNYLSNGVSKTRFSSVKITSGDELINAFNAWKKDMNIE